VGHTARNTQFAVKGKMSASQAGPWAGQYNFGAAYPESGAAMAHRSEPHGDVQRSLVPFMTGNNMQVAPYMHVPRTADTLAFSQRDKIQQILTMLHLKVEEVDGWWFQFAQRNQVSTFDQLVTIKSTDEAMFDRTAELTAPRKLQFREEQYVISMEHYQLGIDMRNEYFNTAEGAEELSIKMTALVAAAVVTHKLAVDACVIDAPNYWTQHWRMHNKFRNIADHTATQRERFGALTKDPMALHKLYSEIPQITAGSARVPQINMAVVPSEMPQIAHWGHQRNTEVWRAGQQTVDRTMQFGGMPVINDMLPVPVYVDKKFRPINAAGDTPIEAFRRRATIGSYAILQYDDHGPKNGCGVAEPAIQFVTMPADDFTTFSMSDALDNCPRFGDDTHGSITQFTQSFIDNESSVRNYWDTHDGNTDNYYNKRALFDAWVYEPKPMAGIPGSNTPVPRLRVCELMGEQDTRHRPEEFDVEQGLCSVDKFGLTPDETTQLNLLFEAADSLYDIDTATATNSLDATYKMLANSNATLSTRTGVANPVPNNNKNVMLDPEWGGPVVFGTRTIPTAGIDSGKITDNAVDAVPYGLGDIFAVMSLMKAFAAATNKEAWTMGGWPYRDLLKYEQLRHILNKIWAKTKDMFPQMHGTDASHAPEFRRTGDADRDAMIATFRGLLERVKHPLWTKGNAAINVRTAFGAASTGDRYVKTGLLDLGGTLLRKMFLAEGTDPHLAKLTKAYDELKAEGLADRTGPNSEIDFKPTSLTTLIGSILNAGAATGTTNVESNRARNATLVNWLLHMLDRYVQGDRSGMLAEKSLTLAKLDGLAMAASNFAEQTYKKPPTGLETANTVRGAERKWFSGLTISKRAFAGTDGTIGNFIATNAFTGAQPIANTAGVGDVAAQGHLRRQTPEEFARRGGTEGNPNVGVFQEENVTTTFGADPAQFIDARRAGVMGGAFVTVDMVGAAEGVAEEQAWVVERQYMSRRVTYIQRQLSHNRLARYGAFCFLLSRVNKTAMKALLNNGLKLPMNFIFAAPFIQIETLACMFAEGGANTARLNYGWTDTTKPEDGIHKITDWNVTTHVGAKVINPKNVILFPDVALAGYVGGMERAFFRKTEDFQADMGGFDPEANQRMFVFDVPVTMSREASMAEHHNPLPLYGRHDPAVYNGIYDQKDRIFNPTEPHFATWPAYNNFWGFERVNTNAQYDESTFRAIRESTFNPGTLYHRATRVFNPAEQKFTLAGGQKGTGHIDDIPVPMLATLSGKLRFRDEYSTFQPLALA
jgi:hypothetical protein